MAFTSYLIEKYDYTHENEFFRVLSANLQKLFKESTGTEVLIGNVNVGGHSIDAIFINNSQITVIDFKNYGGELTFSENNPWKLKTPEEEDVVVTGGAISRNPFNQVKTYKFSLIGLLSSNKHKFLSSDVRDVNFGHISSVVLFHQIIHFDEEQIPPKLRPWFHIKDKDSILNFLADKVSNQLRMSDDELEKLLTLFLINEDNLLENHQFETIEQKVEVKRPSNAGFIRRNLDLNPELEEANRILNYYRAVVDFESKKRPKSDNKLPILLEGDNFKDSHIQINLEKSSQIVDQLKKNETQNFPKNVALYLNYQILDKTIPLFFVSYPYNEIQGSYLVDFAFIEAQLNIDELDQLALPEDTLEALEQQFGECETFEDKVQVVKNLVDENLIVENQVMFSLVESDSFTAQLKSELRSLQRSFKQGKTHSNFEALLRFQNITKKKEENCQQFIQVTQLDKSQEYVVKNSLNQPLSVITGPPGSGKSQVVTNIIVNAVLNNKSVLFASKNHKAIDNVKERLSSLLNYDYFNKLAPKQHLENVVKQNVQKYLNLQSQKKLEDKKNILAKRLAQVNNLFDQREGLEKFLKEYRDGLNQKSQIEIALDKLSSEVESHELTIPVKDYIVLDKNLKDLLTWIDQVTEVGSIHTTASSGFLSNLKFKIFHQKKFNLRVKILESQYFSYFKHQNQKDLSIEDLLTKSDDISPIVAKLDKFRLKKSKLDKELNDTSEYLASCESRLNTIHEKMKQIYYDIVQDSTDVLNDVIHEKLRTMDGQNNKIYIDKVPLGYKSNASLYAEKFFFDFAISSVTSLSIKNAVPLETEIFDYVIFDEASQCDIASGLPLLYRAKRAIIIGDQLQLSHISSLTTTEDNYIKHKLGLYNHDFSYTSHSLYDFAFKSAIESNLETFTLDFHYRCHPEIFNFSKEEFYNKKTGQNITVMTENIQGDDQGIYWVNSTSPMQGESNKNQVQAKMIVQQAIELRKKYPENSIGIVSPFRNQVDLIKRMIVKLDINIQVDTVHKFQGDEKDYMLFSMVFNHSSSKGKQYFVNENINLTNVALTRARKGLFIYGDYEFCYKIQKNNVDTSLASLAKYCESLNKVIL